jgi:L-rhamnose mutarotase
MSRYVMTVNLKNDPAAIAAYREHHRRVWPEVVESLKRVGVCGMDIHLLGRQLVMIVELTDGLDFKRVFATHLASSPRVVEWERLMKSLQEPSSDAAPGEWWAVMEPVFHLPDVEPAVARVGVEIRGPGPGQSPGSR